MTKDSLRKQLQFLLKDLTKVNQRMNKIADKLNTDQHEGVQSALNDVQTLLKMLEEKEGE